MPLYDVNSRAIGVASSFYITRTARFLKFTITMAMVDKKEQFERRLARVELVCPSFAATLSLYSVIKINYSELF